jgi:hypothetical protein
MMNDPRVGNQRENCLQEVTERSHVVVERSPRVALSVEKRKEVAKRLNPDIPFKPSHLGNTLCVPAMIDIRKLPASEILRMVPVKTKSQEDIVGRLEGQEQRGSRQSQRCAEEGAVVGNAWGGVLDKTTPSSHLSRDPSLSRPWTGVR